MEKKEIDLKNFEDEYMIKVKGGSGAYSAKSSLIISRSETIATYSYKNFGFRIVRTINF